MITSADEFIRLRQSESSEEQARATHEEASLETWKEIILKYPDFKTWIIHNKTVPVEILEILSKDPDSNVRTAVARKRKINKFIFNLLSKDGDEDVRTALILNTALSIEQILLINIDDSAKATTAYISKIKEHKIPITLYRPVGPKELKLIEESGWTKFPPRLEQQPIFYPVMNEEYAIQIARDWNVSASGSGFVTRFIMDSDYISKFEVQNVGGAIHNELWVPAEELEEFNSYIIGEIVVAKSFYPEK
jgi:hypothetical protein